MSAVVTEAKNNTRFISWVVRCTTWLYTVFKTEWAQSVSSISNKEYTEGMIWFQTNIAWNNLNLMDDNNPGSHHCELILQKLCVWAWQITAMPSRTEHWNRFLWHSNKRNICCKPMYASTWRLGIQHTQEFSTTSTSTTPQIASNKIHFFAFFDEAKHDLPV